MWKEFCIGYSSRDWVTGSPAIPNMMDINIVHIASLHDHMKETYCPTELTIRTLPCVHVALINGKDYDVFNVTREEIRYMTLNIPKNIPFYKGERK